MVTLSNLTFATGGALVLALTFLGSAWRLGRPDLIAQLAVVMLLRLAGEVLKPIFQSPRPGPEFQPDPSLVPSTLGYPSGHAYTATIVASMLIVFVSVLDLPRGIRWGVSVVAVLITLMALFARVHIGAHWPSDTLGGVLFGVATMAAMQLIIGRLAASGGVTGPCGDDDLLAADRLSGGRDTGR
jgi:undecaprenyl-diphosphatase